MNALTKTSYTIIFITSLIVCSDIYAIAGRVVYSYGDVQATSNTGETRQLLRGGSVDEGDSINTNDGRIQIRFSDGGFVALQPDTIYRLDEYEFEGEADGNEKSSFYLVEGGIRLVTGLIGRKNKETFKLQTPVATIGIRGTSGKVVHTEATGTLLAGYGGIWDLTSGAFNGPVEPGQAYSCNGLSCAEVAGFGQRQEASQEAEEEEEKEEEEEEKEEEDEETKEKEKEEGDQENEEKEEKVAEETEEKVAETKEESVAETKEESVAETKETDGLKPKSEGKFNNIEDAGEPEAFFEAVSEGGQQAIPSDDGEISFFQGSIEENAQNVIEDKERTNFRSGEQRDATGSNAFLTSEGSVTVSSLQSLGAGFAVTRTRDAIERADFAVTGSSNKNTLLFNDSALFAGVSIDNTSGANSTSASSTTAFVSDLTLLEASINSIPDATQRANFRIIISQFSASDSANLRNNPASFSELTTANDISFGRFSNGFLAVASLNEGSNQFNGDILSLTGNKSAHFILSTDLTTAPTSQLVKYDLAAASSSTSSASVGSGITSGSILFDFGLGYGALDASLSHGGTIHTLTGDLDLTGVIFGGGVGLAVNTAGNSHEARFEGFLSGDTNGLPSGIGLSYGILTQDPISGTAIFDQGTVGDVNRTNHTDTSSFGFVGTAGVVLDSGAGLQAADSFLFNLVPATDIATTTGNIVTAFSTTSPNDRCTGTCTFDQNTSTRVLDETGPGAFDHFELSTENGHIANTSLRSNWARFTGNYTLTKDNTSGTQGSAHTIAFRDITPVGTNLPSFLAGSSVTYDEVVGGTHFTHLYTENGTLQSEILSSSTQLQADVNFSTGTVDINFNGNFTTANGSSGQWGLTGSASNDFSASAATAFTSIALTGTVQSTGISGSNGANCSVNCNIVGVTDTVLLGQFADGFGGAVSADTAVTDATQPVFTLSGTYVLEPSANISSTITR